jgi:phenylalanyl-tRNA synthetase beta chain
VPKHQPVERDLAVVVAESVGHAGLMAAIADAATGGLLQDSTLFDIYRPLPARDGVAPTPGALASGEKSMAVRLRFQSEGTTLTDEQVDAAVRAVLDHLAARLGARLRGA